MRLEWLQLITESSYNATIVLLPVKGARSVETPPVISSPISSTVGDPVMRNMRRGEFMYPPRIQDNTPRHRSLNRHVTVNAERRMHVIICVESMEINCRGRERVRAAAA